MVEYRKIKTIEGLNKQTDNQTPKLISETKGLSNAVTVHEDKDLKVNIIQQKNLTANCWLIQMNGFEECAKCECFPFNRKSGKLLKISNCGGGETLALMIYNRFKGSIMDGWKAQEFWKTHKNHESFSDFAQAIRDAEKQLGAKCDIWKHLYKKGKIPKILSYDEHEQALLIECDLEANKNEELHAYLLSIKEKTTQKGFVGFAFVKSKVFKK